MPHNLLEISLRQKKFGHKIISSLIIPEDFHGNLVKINTLHNHENNE